MSSINFMEDDRFDGLYLNVASQTRGIEPLLDTVFSFLRRKTDFFNGPRSDTKDDNDISGCQIAIDKVNDVLLKHAKLYQQQKQKSSSSSTKTKKATPTTTTSSATKKKKVDTKEDVVEMNSDGGFDISTKDTGTPKQDQQKAKNDTVDVNREKPSTNIAATKTVAKTATYSDATINTASTEHDDNKDGDNEKNDGDDDNTKPKPPPPIGNGGSVDGKYTWTQLLSEVVITVPVPENTRGRDLDVVISKQHLKVKLRNTNNTVIVDDQLTKAIICDDSFWTVEDNNQLIITLQKLNTMEWWDSVCVLDESKIDIKLIQPESSSLADLDKDTRQTVEKMMFDQRQKAMGKPTSDESAKLSMLEKFKSQHPELDFSNAKIT